MRKSKRFCVADQAFATDRIEAASLQSDMQSRVRENTGLDLSQKWLQHLREAAKTSVTSDNLDESSKPATGTLDTKHKLSLNPGPLTADKLEHFELKGQERSRVNLTDTRPPNESIKKRAIGHGLSPSSSIRTTFSGLRRVPAKGASPKQISSSKPQFTSQGRYPDLDEGELVRPPATGKQLYQPDSDSPIAAQTTFPNNSSQRPRSSLQQPQRPKNQKSGQSGGGQPFSQLRVSSGEPGLFSASVLGNSPANQQEAPPHESVKIVRQPETRPISQEQLVAEVKGIYAGLVMVEGKCIQVDAKQAALAREAPPGTQPKLNNEQWQALIALHRTLLHEHHDFFLASQHPSATPAVRRLAIKYAMPARLWRHGIHSFLELLRNRLPDSLDHMLSFIYLAYSMMTLLYETVPAFEDTWIECLGDLGRYRMAIEDDDMRDREVWTQVARQWYLKASDCSPETGRLYHHLAILARPNALQQLFFYYKALSVPQPFIAARESFLTLLQPALDGKQARRLPAAITAFVKVQPILFARESKESFSLTLEGLSTNLSSHIGRVTQRYLEQGYYIAISNCLAMLGLGLPNVVLARALSESDTKLIQHPTQKPTQQLTDANMSGTTMDEVATDSLVFGGALQVFCQTVDITLQRIGDPNILPFLYVTKVPTAHVSYPDKAISLLEGNFPWTALVTMSNTLLRFYHNYARIEGDLLPVQGKNYFRPPLEEFAFRGLFWTARYFVPGWFRNKNIEDENQYKDASMKTDYRPKRILWPGYSRPPLMAEKNGFRPPPEELDLRQGYPVTILNQVSASLHRILASVPCLLTNLIPFRFFNGADALPTLPLPERDVEGTSTGFTTFLNTKAKHFTDVIAGPLLLNMFLALVLTLVHLIVVHLNRGLCKDWDLLLMTMISASLSIFFLSADDNYSNWQVVILWIFTAINIVAYLREKLVNLRLSGINAVSIVTLGIGSASLLVNYAEFEGRLADPWIAGCVSVLPAITFFTCLWVAFFHQTRLVQWIEDGTYKKSS